MSESTPKAAGKAAAAPEPPESKRPKVVYTHNEETGTVTREDASGVQHLATVKDGVLYLREEGMKHRVGLLQFLGDEGVKFKTMVAEGEEPDKVKAGIPPRPKRDPQFGDKTPALVEWLRKYRPKEYAARYGIKGPGIITKYRKIPHPDENKAKRGETISEPYQEECILSTRKIPGTEKLIAADAEYSDQDEGGEE